MRFQWDKAKGQKNLKIHGISFAEAVQIFNGPTLETLDTRADYGEDRWIAIGSINDGTFVIVYIEQKPEDEDDVEVYRIISAREATSHERRNYQERR